MELDVVIILRAKALIGVLLFTFAQISFGFLAGLAFSKQGALEVLIGCALLAQCIGFFGLRIRHQARQRVSSLGLAGDPGY